MMIAGLVLILLVAELVYFKLADKLSIIDKPNKRSSHSYITRRGGGIIFPIAWVLYAVYNGGILPYFTIGLLLISVVSFWDDIREVGVIPRISIHSVAIALGIYDLGLTHILPEWGVAVCFVVSLAAINAINFMDGINGITGMYALGFWLTVALFAGILIPSDPLSLTTPLPYIIASLLVFGFFNFRNKAACFAGDIGSVSMAYLMTGMTLFLIFRPEGMLFSEAGALKTEAVTAGFEIKYLLLLSVYGIDSFLTIMHRLFLRENILKGHRKHLYQYLANELQLPHLAIAAAYALLQFGISYWVLNFEITVAHGATLLTLMALLYGFTKTYVIWEIKQAAIRPLPPNSQGSASPPPFQKEKPAMIQDDEEAIIPNLMESRKDVYKKSGLVNQKHVSKY